MTFIWLRFPSEPARPNKISYRWMGRRKRHLERMERCKRRPFLCKSLSREKGRTNERTADRVGYVFRRYFILNDKKPPILGKRVDPSSGAGCDPFLYASVGSFQPARPFREWEYSKVLHWANLWNTERHPKKSYIIYPPWNYPCSFHIPWEGNKTLYAQKETLFGSLHFHQLHHFKFHVAKSTVPPAYLFRGFASQKLNK